MTLALVAEYDHATTHNHDPNTGRSNCTHGADILRPYSQEIQFFECGRGVERYEPGHMPSHLS